MKRILFFVALISSGIIIKNLLFSIYTLWHKQDLVVQTQKELEAQKLKNKKLKEQLSYVHSSQFIEIEARNKLFLVKPGESEVIIPTDLLQASGSAQAVLGKQKSNWEKWAELFF